METKTASMSTPNPIRMDIKVATLNLCLGLQAKKNIVKETIINEKIDILSMQETEIILIITCCLFRGMLLRLRIIQNVPGLPFT